MSPEQSIGGDHGTIAWQYASLQLLAAGSIPEVVAVVGISTGSLVSSSARR